MKHKILFLIIAGIIIILATMLSGPAAIFIAKRQLKNIFNDSAVTIKKCSINPLNSVIFSGIEINKPSSYNIKYEQISIRYNLGIIEFSAKDFFGGSADGNVKLTLGMPPAYAVDIRLRDIDLGALAKDFRLEEKVQVSGKIKGNVFIKGKGSKLEDITGNLEVLSPGGELTIKDADYLKKMPVKSGVSWEDLVASLKNYMYNIGTVKSSLENNNLTFTVSLSGKTGKRDFTIVLHDFKI